MLTVATNAADDEQEAAPGEVQVPLTLRCNM